MRRIDALLIVGLLVLSTVPIGLVTANDAPSTDVNPPMSDVAQHVIDGLGGLGGLGGGFVENRGQFPDAGVRYYAPWGGGGGIAFLDGTVAMAVEDGGSASVGPAPNPRSLTEAALEGRPLTTHPDVEGCVVRLEFEGAREVRPVARCPVPGVRNYLLGDDPTAWATGVGAYTEVVYEGLWDDIDLVYRACGGFPKYEFVVGPGADPSAIRVRVDGAASLTTARGGSELRIGTPAGTIIDGGLVAYQEATGAVGGRDAVECAFRPMGGSVYGFDVAGRDPDHALVIDPMVYGSYIGGGGEDQANIVRRDASGRLYVAGLTASTDFPITAGVYQRSHGGGEVDGYVVRLSADLTSLDLATFLGGGGDDIITSLFVDDSGDVHLGGGTSSTNFPTDASAPQTENMGGEFDAFVCTLDSNFQTLGQSTYVGGSAFDAIFGVACGADGSTSFAGFTNSSDLSTTSGCFQEDLSGFMNSLAGRLNASGDSYDYLTYVGGSLVDVCLRMTMDSSGSVYMTGETYSDDYPTTQGAYQRVLVGIGDVFVTKLEPDGSGLSYSTLIGGTNEQAGQAIVLDGSNRAHVAGYTTSTNYPTTSGAYQAGLEGDDDAFVSVISSDGKSLVSSTYLGGTVEDHAVDVALDPNGDILVCGITESTDFPTSSGAASAGGQEGFLSKFSNDLKELVVSEYVGGSDDDLLNSVLADGTDHALAVGSVMSDDIAVSVDAVQATYGGGVADGVIVRLLFDLVAPVADAGADVTIDQHQTVELNGSRSADNLGIVNFTWSFRYNGSNVELYDAVVDFTFHEAGHYSITLTVVDVGGLDATDELNVTVRDITAPVANAGPNVTVVQHTWVTFDSSRCWDNVGIVGYEWTFVYDGEPQVLKLASSGFMFDAAGIYDVTLNITDAVGLWATDETRVTVLDITEPIAEAGPDIEVGQHETVTFNGTGSYDNVGIVNWTWAFLYAGTPVALNGAMPTFVFDKAGTYTVTLTVSDDRGYTSADTVTVKVLDVEPPTAVAGDDITVNQGEKVVLDGGESTDNVVISDARWEFVLGGTTRTLDGLVNELTFTDAGVYVITLTVTDAAGNEASDSLTVTVLDVESPTALANEAVTIDQHDEVDFDGSGSFDNVGVVSWKWTFTYRGAPVTLDGVTVSYTFDDAGEYYVILTVADAMGNEGTDGLTVTVKDTTDPVAEVGADLTVDQGREATLDGSASSDNVAIDEWKWSFTDEGAPIKLWGEVQTYTFVRPGIYDVTLTVYDAEGNLNSTVLRVTVRDTVAPAAVVPEHITVESGQTVQLDGSLSTDNVGVTRWVWTFQDGGKDVELEGQTLDYKFKDEGGHIVTLTVYDAEGNVNSDVFTVTVETGDSPMLIWLVVVVIVVAVVLTAIAIVMLKRRGPSAA